MRRLLFEAARATLELTGVRLTDADRDGLRRSVERAEALPKTVLPGVHALFRVAEAAAASRDAPATLAAEVHALATDGEGLSPYRSEQIPPQFAGARLSPPQTIDLRLAELAAWISGESGRDLVTAPRAALFFARFLEIAPFRSAEPTSAPRTRCSPSSRSRTDSRRSGSRWATLRGSATT